LECGSPLPLFKGRRDSQSGRRLPQFKTLGAIRRSWDLFGGYRIFEIALWLPAPEPGKIDLSGQIAATPRRLYRRRTSLLPITAFSKKA